MGQIVVSVIIPVFNRIHLLQNTVQSVLNQNLSNFELLIVDNGSSEDVSGFVSKLKDKRVKYLSHGKNNGPAIPRNEGIRKAKGKYISFFWI